MTTKCFICDEPIIDDSCVVNGKPCHKKCHEDLTEQFRIKLIEYRNKNMKLFKVITSLFVLLFMILIAFIYKEIISIGEYLGLLVIAITVMYLIYLGINK